MAISAATCWRVRIDGSDTLCSGMFDPSVVGAGIDYTEQPSAQLALTDLTSVSPYTSVGSVMGGFTAEMIGNGLYIASGTGFIAGYYLVTGFTSTNAVILDRACATATASSGVAKLGGALGTPGAVQSMAVIGNTVFIRGQGSNDPIDIDYSMMPQVSAFGNFLTYIGYNGRPKISHSGKIWQNLADGFICENCYFVQTSATYLSDGIATVSSAGDVLFYNCILDQGGYDSTQAKNIALVNCSVINTGSPTLGTRFAAIQSDPNGTYTAGFYNCLIKDTKFGGVQVYTSNTPIMNCIIQSCAGDGINILSTGVIQRHSQISNNTIYGCAGHGISMVDCRYNRINGNIIANITGVGKHGIYVSSTAYGESYKYSSQQLAGNVFHGNTSNSNLTLAASNLTVDPQFANAPIDLTPTNTALRTIGGVGAL